MKKTKFQSNSAPVVKFLGVSLAAACLAFNPFELRAERGMESAAVMQTSEIKGTIVDEIGEPLMGVTVVIKGTTRGTVTDFDGNFVLEGKAGEELEISYLGYRKKELKAQAGTVMKIALELDSKLIDEVVVVGYAVQKKSVITGAISSVDTDDIMKARPANAVNALSGRVSGVNIVSGGQPGSTPKLVIRGIGTNGNSNPLYIIDGIPLDDMNNLNPNDIESMEVLKDATSAAIYGARAANGVVLITTKKGEKNKTSLTYDGYYGWSSVQRTPDMMNAAEFGEMIPEFYANDGQVPPSTFIYKSPNGVDTNWMDALFEVAPTQEHNITATMGSEKGTALFSLNYLDQNGIIGGDKSFFNRFTFRNNNRYEVNEFITVGSNLNYTYKQTSGISTGTNGWNAIQYAFNMEPTVPVYDPNNSDGYGLSTSGLSRCWNPLSFIENSGESRNIQQHIYGNIFAEIKFLKDFKFRTDFGVNHKNNNNRSFSPIFFHGALYNSTKNTVNQSSNIATNWQWENTLHYSKSFGDHNLNVLLGMTALEEQYSFLNGSRNGLPVEANDNDNYWYLNAGDIASSTNSGGANARHAMFSYFGRVNYDYANKYMMELVVRRDGSSNFGPKQKYATFPGMSFGWNISNEDFWDVDNFDSLKLRASWGQNGNERISPFSYTSVIGNNYYYTLGTTPTIMVGSTPNSLVNPDVRWETSEQFNIGIDGAWLGGSLQGSIDFFNKKTKDLLFKPTLEAVRGNSAPFVNLGEISNKGVELQVSYRKMVGDVFLNLSANASYLKNTVNEIGNTNGYEDGGLWREVTRITRLEEGHSMGYFRLYQTDGIFQTAEEVAAYKNDKGEPIQPKAVPGDFKWVDADGDGKITEKDRTDLGNPWPKWVFGLNIGLEWKGFDFNMLINGKADFDVYAAQTRKEGYGQMNLPTFYLDRWQKPGDNNGVPRFTIADPNGNYDKPSDFYLYDGTFLKIGSMEIGYTIPKVLTQKALLSQVRVYAAVDNLCTFTKYPYMDPEIADMRGWGGNILEYGMDYGSYPLARTFRIGARLAF